MLVYNKKKEKFFIYFFQLLIIILFLIIWELLARSKIINTFLFSSPSNIYKTIISLFNNYNLINHLKITTMEVLIGFFLTSILGILIAIVLWWFPMLYKIIDPYLTILNSLPKVALGPLIIIWFGSGMKAIIFMSITICVFTTILNVYQGFSSVQDNIIIMIKSFGANKWQIFNKVVFPSTILVIMTTLKINISLCLVGVIMGELLVSKAGLGYLIMYGSQVFNIDLVISSIFILGILSYFLYFIIEIVIKKIVI